MAKPFTASALRLFNCQQCGLLSKQISQVQSCPRCQSRLHFRKPNSLQRTWAFIIAAYILYIPANLLPVMNTSSILSSEKDTILSGVFYLWTSGSWPLAILVFAASITIPGLKLLILTLLAWTASKKKQWRNLERARLFRIVEFIGRWSMLDIFVTAMMVGLVRFGPIASVTAGPGAIAFALVVICTMLAALSFDPRLIWDLPSDEHDKEND
ncbi:paraquat-inducible protein A [Deefgea piscis]|uniref:Paraquat-inducible protein A n=1 Tax=Deefgea piscis TaxID=2739061 RepID=A0A6M8SXW9_9NEIS|nr:paraquat-inducible protein A [Deefgea piscis]QKJ67439.1 paraquat-inducible protein A [Deefgea piscis]